MPAILRWWERVAFWCLALVGVTSAIGCVVAIATQRWGQLPLQLLFTLAFAGVVTLRVRARRAKGTHPTPRERLVGVARLRTFAATFAATLILMATPIATMKQPPDGPVLPWVPVLAVASVLALAVVRLTAIRPLDCASPALLAESYRTRFFLRFAFATTPALFAFSFTFIGAPTWTYYAGAPVSLVLIATSVVPTNANLARDQADLDARGCSLSLVDALKTGAPTR